MSSKLKIKSIQFFASENGGMNAFCGNERIGEIRKYLYNEYEAVFLNRPIQGGRSCSIEDCQERLLTRFAEFISNIEDNG